MDSVANRERWHWPGPGPACRDERVWWEKQLGKLKKEKPGIMGPGFWWRYLKRCYRNPSMMNRRRIWGCVKQIEASIEEQLLV